MATRQSRKKEEMAQEVRKSYLKRRRGLRKRHLKWLETLYAIHGEQHRVLKGDHLIDMAALRPDDVDHIQVTHNHLFQAYRAMLATAMQSDPTPVVTLARPGRDGRQLSRSCERLLQYIYHDKDMRESVRSALSWTFTCGVGFLGAAWDLTADDPTWVPKMDENGQVIYKTEKKLIREANGETS